MTESAFHRPTHDYEGNPHETRKTHRPTGSRGRQAGGKAAGTARRPSGTTGGIHRAGAGHFSRLNCSIRRGEINGTATGGNGTNRTGFSPGHDCRSDSSSRRSVFCARRGAWRKGSTATDVFLSGISGHLLPTFRQDVRRFAVATAVSISTALAGARGDFSADRSFRRRNRSHVGRERIRRIRIDVRTQQVRSDTP